MVRYLTNGHFSGSTAGSSDLTVHVPWLYIIACVQDRLLYVGETFDRAGLVGRLSTHFGYHNSSLRQTASEFGGVRSLKPPFVVIAAELPTDEPMVRFDCSSKGVRLLVEAVAHNRLARFATERGWTIISSAQSSIVRENADIVEACNSISVCVQSTLEFVEGLTKVSPFHFVTLGWRRDASQDDHDLGRMLNRIEITLCRYVLRALKDHFGERWWPEGVPVNTRQACAQKQEEEAGVVDLPKEAYLTLIDLRKVIEKNWFLFGEMMQRLSGRSGRERATEWIREVNDLRKHWAHPIKQIYSKPVGVETQQFVRLISLELHSLVSTNQLGD